MVGVLKVTTRLSFRLPLLPLSLHKTSFFRSICLLDLTFSPRISTPYVRIHLTLILMLVLVRVFLEFLCAPHPSPIQVHVLDIIHLLTHISWAPLTLVLKPLPIHLSDMPSAIPPHCL